MRGRIDHAWRVIATGASFVLFGVGGLLLTVLVLPPIRLFVRSPRARKKHTQRLISAAFSVFIGFMRRVGVLDYQVKGLEHLHTPGCVVVANHPSLIDVVFLIALMPEVDCVVKRRLWRNPVTAATVRMAGYISNVEAPMLLQRCQASLNAGNRLIIFPEATRTRTNQPLCLQRGAANIALHAGADMVPVTIVFRQATLGKGEPWYHVPSEKMYLSISVGTPIATRVYLEKYGNIPRAARHLTADLSDYYETRLATAARLSETEGHAGGGNTC